jgi:hypothetical protein
MVKYARRRDSCCQSSCAGPYWGIRNRRWKLSRIDQTHSFNLGDNRKRLMVIAVSLRCAGLLAKSSRALLNAILHDQLPVTTLQSLQLSTFRQNSQSRPNKLAEVSGP